MLLKVNAKLTHWHCVDELLPKVKGSVEQFTQVNNPFELITRMKLSGQSHVKLFEL
jgi:hypothetical protein